MSLVTVLTKPEELGGFPCRIRRELEQLAISEIAEFSSTPRIVTFGNHGASF
jgi:hypothetical protein